jgi:hypothetical protein
MYKIIVDGQIVYSTDDKYEFAFYCQQNNYSASILALLLGDSYEANFGTA